tara:strand:- start:48 stop:479 length:432 start_codon:yes stop_codon:yes gene_type:complete
MAITFVNNWKNILDKLRSILRSEFKSTMPVYIGSEDIRQGSQYIRIIPLGSSVVNYNSTKNIKQYSIGVEYVFTGANIRKSSIDNILRFVERTQHLVADNESIELADGTQAFNCRFEENSLNTGNNENSYTSNWIWICMHLDV